MNMTGLFAFSVLVLVLAAPVIARADLFEGNRDVGTTEHPGSVEFVPETEQYRITGSGANMWYDTDAFHFLYRRLSGDMTLTADIEWIGTGHNAHRKAGLMARQDLEPDSPYADTVVHGDGLISLQYREVAGGDTMEIQAPVSGPATLKLDRNGDLFSLSIKQANGAFQPVGSISLSLTDPVYAGLVVCSHDGNVSETAIFSNVNFQTHGVASTKEGVLESTLEIMSITAPEMPAGPDAQSIVGRRSILYRARQHFEAPNWSRNGKYLLFNSRGRIYTIPTEGGEPKLLDTSTAVRCNNDHGLSPDGKWLAVSHSPKNMSLIYVLPSQGGEPRLVTPNGPSYWHGWSPDGRTLAYCAQRHGEYDVYTIPVEGGKETRLTDTPGLDDGPDYSHDGEYIYFNSERTGLMKIWRMRADGSDQQQVTFDDEYADWFPHPSPDGKWLVFLSYNKDVKGHPAEKDVALRIMSCTGGEPVTVARFHGGQGTINVPSWSPDSTRFAFVSYRRVKR